MQTYFAGGIVKFISSSSTTVFCIARYAKDYCDNSAHRTSWYFLLLLLFLASKRLFFNIGFPKQKKRRIKASRFRILDRTSYFPLMVDRFWIQYQIANTVCVPSIQVWQRETEISRLIFLGHSCFSKVAF